MAGSSLVWSSFNDGELSPLLDGRVDMPQYMKGAEIMVNMIPTIQGPAVRRGGSRYIGLTTVNGNPSVLIRFSRSQTESYVLEFSSQSLRFYFNGALVTTNAPPYAAYTVPTPYLQADLFNADGTPAIVAVESADVIYLAHPKYPPQVLSFHGPGDWTLAPLVNVDGPWMDGNTIKTRQIYSTGGVTVGSTVTLTSNTANTFAPGHAGSLFRLHQQDLTTIKPWAPGERTPQLLLGVQRRAGFLTYQCSNANRGTPPTGGVTLLFVQSGNVTPVQTEGFAWDGDQSTVIDPIGSSTYYSTGVQWLYQDCGYGVVLITEFTDDRHVNGIVMRQLPVSVTNVSGASYKWEMGAWNAANGYPSTVTIFLQRLVFGGKTWVWGSVVGDFANFADMDFGEVTDDSAFSVQCLSSQVNDILYFSPSQTLMVGTSGGEFMIGPQSISDPFGPSNLGVSLQSEYGGRAVVPVRVQQYTLFVTKNGRALREFSFNFTAGPAGANVSQDLTVLSEHITESGIIGMAWAKNPYTTVYIVLGNGNLISLTYNPEQSVRAWARHDIAGGDVICVTVVPNGTGDWDDVYMTVRRSQTVGDITTVFYTIERLEQPFQNLAGENQQDCFYVDCGATLDNSINATLLLGHGDYTVRGTQDISFFASGAVFASTDIGRYIHYDYTVNVVGEDGLPAPVAAKAVAQITSFTNSHFVNGTILFPFPNFAGESIPANAWRMTVTRITNPLSAWKGATVSILADGACQPDQVLDYSGDPIELPYPASIVQCGLKSPSVWRSMKPEGGDPTGSNMGKLKKEIRFVVRYVNSLGFSFGPSWGELIEIDQYLPSQPSDIPRPVATGETERFTWNGDWDRYGRVMLAQTQPLPFTLAAVAMLFTVESDS